MNKNGSGKLDKIAIFISVMSIVVTSILTVYSFNLYNQANELSKENLELQNMLTNFTTTIAVNPENQEPVGFLYSNYFSYSNGTIDSIGFYGQLSVNLKVVTPHYSNITIEVGNLTDIDPQFNMNPQKKNLTTVSYVFEDEKYENVIGSGLIELNPTLPLSATVYINPQILPAQGQKVQFPIGTLHLQAVMYDLQTQEPSTHEFTALILAVVTVPYS